MTQSNNNAPVPEDQLVQLATAGDLSALQQLFELYRCVLINIAQRLYPKQCLPRGDRSDVVQDSLLRATSSIKQLRGRTFQEFRSWLNTILANVIASKIQHENAECRDIRKEQYVIEPNLEHHEFECNDDQDESQQVIFLRKYQERLSDEERALLDYRQNGYTFEEISEKMNLSCQSVRKRYQRLIKRITEGVNEMAEVEAAIVANRPNVS